MNKRVAILSAVRTPIGKFLGALASFKASELGAFTIKESLQKAHINPEDVDLVIMGSVLQGGQGQGPARQASIRGGIPPHVPAYTVNMVCGSGMISIIEGIKSILLGDAKIVVAGGMESMSNAPYAIFNLRTGAKFGNVETVDLMIYDGLIDYFSGVHMGNLAEYTAKKANLKREELDEFSYHSHMKAIKATQNGLFEREIVKIEISQKKGETQIVDKDEGPRKDTSLEKLAQLKPVFEKDGMVTAGNSSQLSDGAACVVLGSEEFVKERDLKPLAWITDYYYTAVEPKELFFAPIYAIRGIMKKRGINDINEFDLIEINEAFASQTLANTKELRLNLEKLNVHGGAIALGHPIGASGTRIVVTLVHALHTYNKNLGLASLCIGGGMSTSLIIERE